MSIKGAKARKTFHWADNVKAKNILYRIPQNIRYNDNIVVREDEWAIFLRDGKVLAVFDRPGRYVVTTQNIPILAKLGSAITGVKQLGEVFYIHRSEQRGQFGTIEPLAFRDSEFGLVRIRVFGDFSYKVNDPTIFLSEFIGVKGYNATIEVVNWLRSQLIMSFNDILGELKRDKNMSVIDMPAYLEEFEQLLISRVTSATGRYGMKVMKIVGLHISLPDEVQEAIDKRSAMGALGVDYIQYETGKAIGGVGQGAASDGGGNGSMAGMGAGLGAGIGMAQSMTRAIQTSNESGSNPIKKSCPKCMSAMDADARFCPKCGEKIVGDGNICSDCSTPNDADSKFCKNCGKDIKS